MCHIRVFLLFFTFLFTLVLSAPYKSYYEEYLRNAPPEEERTYGGGDGYGPPAPYDLGTPVYKPLPLPNFHHKGLTVGFGQSSGTYRPGAWRPVWTDKYDAVSMAIGAAETPVAYSQTIYVPRLPPPVYADFGALTHDQVISEKNKRRAHKDTLLGQIIQKKHHGKKSHGKSEQLEHRSNLPSLSTSFAVSDNQLDARLNIPRAGIPLVNPADSSKYRSYVPPRPLPVTEEPPSTVSKNLRVLTIDNPSSVNLNMEELIQTVIATVGPKESIEENLLVVEKKGDTSNVYKFNGYDLTRVSVFDYQEPTISGKAADALAATFGAPSPDYKEAISYNPPSPIKWAVPSINPLNYSESITTTEKTVTETTSTREPEQATSQWKTWKWTPGSTTASPNLIVYPAGVTPPGNPQTIAPTDKKTMSKIKFSIFSQQDEVEPNKNGFAPRTVQKPKEVSDIWQEFPLNLEIIPATIVDTGSSKE